jgi:N utilization substance protein B
MTYCQTRLNALIRGYDRPQYLRIALWEIVLEGNTPIKVAINEAVELAKVYGSDSTPRFVNGVLGSLVLHQNEIHQAFKSSDDSE